MYVCVHTYISDRLFDVCSYFLKVAICGKSGLKLNNPRKKANLR